MANVQQWTGALVTNLGSAWDTFQAAVAALSASHFTPLSFVNVSYRTAGAVRAAPVVDAVLQSVVQDRICSQRRRLGQLLPE